MPLVHGVQLRFEGQKCMCGTRDAQAGCYLLIQLVGLRYGVAYPEPQVV